jgi:hypothetical protein
VCVCVRGTQWDARSRPSEGVPHSLDIAHDAADIGCFALGQGRFETIGQLEQVGGVRL